MYISCNKYYSKQKNIGIAKNVIWYFYHPENEALNFTWYLW